MKKTAAQIAVGVLRKLAGGDEPSWDWEEEFYREQVPADYMARYLYPTTDDGTVNGYEDRHLQQSISGGPAPQDGARVFPSGGINFTPPARQSIPSN